MYNLLCVMCLLFGAADCLQCHFRQEVEALLTTFDVIAIIWSCKNSMLFKSYKDLIFKCIPFQK